MKISYKKGYPCISNLDGWSCFIKLQEISQKMFGRSWSRYYHSVVAQLTEPPKIIWNEKQLIILLYDEDFPYLVAQKNWIEDPRI